MKVLCRKHKAEHAKWSDFGPWNPLPKGVTLATVRDQLRLIREACESGKGCGHKPIPKSLREAFNMSGDGDVWANVVAWRVAIAELLQHTSWNVPARWEFQHTEGICSFPQTWEEEEILNLWDITNNRFDPNRERWGQDELIWFGDVLHRYAAILQAQGKDY